MAGVRPMVLSSGWLVIGHLRGWRGNGGGRYAIGNCVEGKAKFCTDLSWSWSTSLI